MRTVIAIVSGTLAACAFAFGASAEDTPTDGCLTASASGDPKAVEICMAALEQDPENQEVKKALEVAKASIGGDETTTPAKIDAE